MGAIADALRKIIDNPDDLTDLPNLIAKVEEVENQEENYQLRIGKLQDLNKQYLAQIPIPGDEPEEEEEENQEVTFEDAKDNLLSAMNEIRGGNE